MPGYLDELLRMLGQAQVPPGVTRAVSHPSMWGADMEGEALRQAMAPPSRPQPTMDELLAALGAQQAPVSALPQDMSVADLVQMSQQRAPFYDAAPYEQVLGPNASPTTGVPVPVTRDNPMAYGNNMQMPAQEMEPANMDIRSLLAALAGAGGGFAAGRMTAPQHTMPDGTVMPGSEEEMYRAAAASMPQAPEDLTNGGQRVPGSMRMPMPPPYKTPPQLQRLNNLRMP